MKNPFRYIKLRFQAWYWRRLLRKEANKFLSQIDSAKREEVFGSGSISGWVPLDENYETWAKRKEPDGIIPEADLEAVRAEARQLKGLE